MNRHPYLRAYMAGIAVPTMVLVVVGLAFTIARFVYDVPLPIERVVVFPMAVVPNAWGLWNIAYHASRRRIPIGVFGAILPILIVPLAWLATRVADFPIPHLVAAGFPFFFPLSLAIYYLAWKHLVGSLNAIVGLA